MPKFKRVNREKEITDFAAKGSPENTTQKKEPKERISLVISKESKRKLIEKIKEANIYPLSLNSYLNSIIEEHLSQN